MPEYEIMVSFTATADNEDDIVDWLNDHLTNLGLLDWSLQQCQEVGA